MNLKFSNIVTAKVKPTMNTKNNTQRKMKTIYGSKK